MCEDYKVRCFPKSVCMGGGGGGSTLVMGLKHTNFYFFYKFLNIYFNVH